MNKKGAKNKKRIIPGFGVSLGITLTLLSIIVLIPMASLIISLSGITFKEFIEIVTTKEVLSARVILPEIFPAILTGFGLALARGIGEYGSVIFIAGNIPFKTQVVPLIIMTKLEQYKYTDATSIAIVMLVISFIILLLINIIQSYVSKRAFN